VRAIEYIDRHYSNSNLSLADVALAVDRSTWYMARMLKRHTGFGFCDLLHRARIAAARPLVTDTLMSMKQVAAVVGYQNTTSFDRQFRKHVGVTPTTLRHPQYHRKPVDERTL
jgi:YesN/AraC family two-component response regulator